jgi:hemerythrin-like domain-containing protein
MPVVIGGKPESSFSDPIGLLSDCHRRIERFLSVLDQIADLARGGPLTDEQRKSLDSALTYFRQPATKHTADEEESLFPRLRSVDTPEARAVLEKLEELEKEHAHAEKSHAEVDRLGRAWLSAGSLAPVDAATFSALVTELANLYRRHISIEETEVFTVAARALSKAEREDVGREMAARRGLL